MDLGLKGLKAIVTGGTRRGLVLQMPQDVREVHGYGLEGRVGDHQVKLGKASWIVGGDSPPWVRQVRPRQPASRRPP